MRTTVLVLAVGAALGLTLRLSSGGFGIGTGLLLVACALVAVLEAGNLVAAVRDRSPSGPPPSHTWWMCELPVDHQFVLARASTPDNPTWRCQRCGRERHTPPPRSVVDTVGSAETSWIERHDR